jgi:hypothetical protein
MPSATKDLSVTGPVHDGLRPPVPVASGDHCRTSERTLRIVFPAHVDETGTLHDEAVAWAVVENPRWAAELRRKAGEDTADPLMRQLRRKLKAATGADRAHRARRTWKARPSEQRLPDRPKPEPFDLGQPFQPSSSLEDTPSASPLVLPSTAREAVAGAKAPAVEGFDMSPPPHDRTPRPSGGAQCPAVPERYGEAARQSEQPPRTPPTSHPRSPSDGRETQDRSSTGLLTGLLGDAEHAEQDRPALMLDMLSDWLPYRVYDPASRLYFNARSKGFVLSVTPLIGADERTGEILGQFFSEGLPAGACLQVLHLASPRISRIVAPWFAPRYMQGGVYEAIARHRARRLYSLVWESGSQDAPFHARHHQVIVSVGVPRPRRSATRISSRPATA